MKMLSIKGKKKKAKVCQKKGKEKKHTDMIKM